VAVYRMHPLIPDDFRLCSWPPAGSSRRWIFRHHREAHHEVWRTRASRCRISFFPSAPASRASSCTTPKHLQHFPEGTTPRRPRRRHPADQGMRVPRYNEFRRKFNLARRPESRTSATMPRSSKTSGGLRPARRRRLMWALYPRTPRLRLQRHRLPGLHPHWRAADLKSDCFLHLRLPAESTHPKECDGSPTLHDHRSAPALPGAVGGAPGVRNASPVADGRGGEMTTLVVAPLVLEPWTVFQVRHNTSTPSAAPIRMGPAVPFLHSQVRSVPIRRPRGRHHVPPTRPTEEAPVCQLQAWLYGVYPDATGPPVHTPPIPTRPDSYTARTALHLDRARPPELEGGIDLGRLAWPALRLLLGGHWGRAFRWISRPWPRFECHPGSGPGAVSNSCRSGEGPVGKPVKIDSALAV